MRPFPFVERPVVIVDAVEFPDSLDHLDFVKELPFYPGHRVPGPIEPGIHRLDKPKSLWVVKESCGIDAHPILHEVVAHRLLNWYSEPNKNGVLRVAAVVYNSRTMKIHKDTGEWKKGDRAYKVTPYYDSNLGYIPARGENDTTRAMMASFIFLCLLDYTDTHYGQFLLDPRAIGDSFLRPLRLIDPGGSLAYAPHGHPKQLKQAGKTIPVPGSWGASVNHFDILPAMYAGLHNPYIKKLVERLHGSEMIQQAQDILIKYDQEKNKLPAIFALLGNDAHKHLEIFCDRLAVLRRMIQRYAGQTDVLKTEILTPRSMRDAINSVSLERRAADAPISRLA